MKQSLLRFVLLAVVALSAGLGHQSSALAQEDSGLVGLHDLRVERRGLLCMTDHFHVGVSSGQPTRKIALREAIYSWAGFTSWEYGDHWGDYRLARSKTKKCSRSGASWSCEVNARPCRKIKRRAVKRRKARRGSRRKK